jgi:hypothetical protein
MGWTSYDDFITEVTTNGKKNLTQFTKTSLATAGVAGTYYSAWPWTGFPVAGGYSGTALNAQLTDDTTAGAIPHGGNVSADTKHLLWMSVMCAAATGVPGKIILYDRLLYYPGINAAITTNQALVNGVSLARYTTGAGVRCWLENTVALGTATGVLTFGTSGYTNSAGTTGRQHGTTVNTVASSAVARIPHSGQAVNMHNPYLPMQSGDLGVRSVQSIQFTTAHSAGTVALVLGKPLASLPIPAVNVMSERDFMFQIASLERVFDGACLSLLIYEPGALVASTPYEFELGVGWG